MVIEIDGATHLSTEENENDRRRTADLEKVGLKVLRFWNDDVFNGLEIIAEEINSEINKLK